MAFKWDVNLGHLLTAVPLIVLGSIYVGSTHSDLVNLSDVVKHQQTILDGMATRNSVDQLRTEMIAGFQNVRTDITNLPSVQAELIQAEKRQDQLDHRVDALSQRVDQGARNGDLRDARIAGLADLTGRLAPIVDGLDRASKMALGHR